MEKIILDLLSDTHSQHSKFICAGGDILLHSGDVSKYGHNTEIMKFIEWFSEQQYTYKIFVPGNHDFDLEDNFEVYKKKCDELGVILLNDSGITLNIKGQEIKVWGSPVQPWFHSWAFNRARTESEATKFHGWIKPHWDLIPKDTEILLTHGPAMGIGDEVTRVDGSSYDNPLHVGCEELANRLKEIDVKLHVFGHIHEGRGTTYVGPRTYVNASSLDRMYWPVDPRPMRVIREAFQDGSIGYVE